LFTFARVAPLCAALLLSSLPHAAAWAQRTVNRCTDAKGQTVLSDRPCVSAPAQLGSYGPQQQAQPRYGGAQSTSYQPPLQRAPEHLKHMSGECARLNEAIRTAPSRGLRYDVIRELRDEYAGKCREEEWDARAQQNQDERRERQAREARQHTERAGREAQARQREQCGQLQEVLQARRRNLDTMTEGDRAALARTQASYDERCVR
jgi:hypothetical protein